MKKLMLLAAMLALVVVAASPAFAQSGSQIEVEEGDVEISDTSTVEGSIVQNCPATVTFGDGNVNVQGVETGQVSNVVIDGDENELAIEQALEQAGFNPSAATACTQEIAQAAAAGEGKAEAKAGGAEAKAGEAPKAEAKAGGGAEAKAGGAEAKAELPKTGGGASLLALGAGALLVGGGLVARRIIK
jgi:LPXTG-motif cell wall-anchored protein